MQLAEVLKSLSKLQSSSLDWGGTHVVFGWHCWELGEVPVCMILLHQLTLCYSQALSLGSAHPACPDAMQRWVSFQLPLDTSKNYE